MTDSDTLQAIEQALGTVMDPELHKDLMTLQMVKDIRVDGDVVSLRVVLTTPACPLKDKIQHDIEKAVIGPVSGIRSVAIQWDAQVTATRGLAGRREIPGVKNALCVSAGKGGVGKTTVSVNIALALSRTGAKVGLLDADVYGPNVPIMLGLSEQPEPGVQNRIKPMEAHGIKVMSFGTILKPGQPVIWRGPMLAKALNEFLYEVEWGDLDYLVIDLPPGTGDVQLSLAQSMPMTGAVIVTTPQDVSLADVSRGIQMFTQLKVPVLGIVENMSGFICSHCHEKTDIFGSGGGRALAERFDLPFLGEIPLDPSIRLGGGDGVPLVASAPESEVGKVFAQIAAQAAARVSQENFASAAGPIMPTGPRIPVKVQ